MATAAIFGYMAIAVSAAVIAGLLIEEVLRSRKGEKPTSPDWIIVGDEKGSLIGEFIETGNGG